MSAIACFRWEGGIVFASDGVTYDNTGAVRGFVSKVLPIVELDCIIANTGAGGFAGNVRDQLTLSCRNFDEVVMTLVELVGQTHDKYKLCYQHAADATVIVGGWSEQHAGFEIYRVATRPKVVGAATIEPLILTSIEGPIWVSNNPGDEVLSRFGVGQGAINNSYDWAARNICASRAVSGMAKDPDADGVPYGVGGFLQMTVLERNKITTWIAHRWPDEIGKPIDPNAGEPMPEFPIKIPAG